MDKSQNGYPVPPPRTHEWQIPNTGRHFNLIDGPEGFALAHLTLWFTEVIEPIGGGQWDDWGGVSTARTVRGNATDLSNHDSYTAVDLNSLQHPRGKDRTFSPIEIAAVHRRLYAMDTASIHGSWYPRRKTPDGWDSNSNDAVIRWGQDYHRSPCDGMHFEWNGTPHQAVRLSAVLLRTRRGTRVMQANKGANCHGITKFD